VCMHEQILFFECVRPRDECEQIMDGSLQRCAGDTLFHPWHWRFALLHLLLLWSGAAQCAVCSAPWPWRLLIPTNFCLPPVILFDSYHSLPRRSHAKIIWQFCNAWLILVPKLARFFICRLLWLLIASLQ
jgi:hypothetical protein